MKIIQSYWSKPYSGIQCESHLNGWQGKADLLFNISLSSLFLIRTFGDVTLVTDQEGKRLLIDTLHIPFAACDLSLESLSHYPAELPVLCKLHIFSEQHEPFIYFNNDLLFTDDKIISLAHQGILVKSRQYEISSYWDSLINFMNGNFEGMGNLARTATAPCSWLYDLNLIGGADHLFLREFGKTGLVILKKNLRLTIKGVATLPAPEKVSVNLLLERYFFSIFAGNCQSPIHSYFNAEDPDPSFDDIYCFPNHAKVLNPSFEEKNEEVRQRIIYLLMKEFPDHYFRIISLL